MPGRLSHLIQVVMFTAGAEAFLRRTSADVIALFDPEKDVFELIHPGVGEKQRGIVRGQKRAGAYTGMAVPLKIL